MPKINFRDYDEDRDELPAFEKVIRNRVKDDIKTVKNDFSDARRTKTIIRGYDDE